MTTTMPFSISSTCIQPDEFGLLDETGTCHGLNASYNDIYTWIQATDNNYIPYSYPATVNKSRTKNPKTDSIRKERKLLKLVTNKIKRNRLNKFSQF
jgi:hypothetical protein